MAGATDGHDAAATSPRRADTAPPPEQWSTAEVAEDLLAQVEAAFVVGMAPAQVAAQLEGEGLTAATAQALAAAIDAATLPDGRGAGMAGALNLWPARIHLRAADPLRRGLDPGRQAALAGALREAGLAPALAAAVCQDIAVVEGAMLTSFRDRRRRLGQRGVLVGTPLTLILGAMASDGGTALWHLVGTGAAAALTAYSVVLWRSYAASPANSQA